MNAIQAVMDRIEEVTLPSLRSELELLESGAAPSDIGRMKLAIEQHEQIVAKLRKAQGYDRERPPDDGRPEARLSGG